MFTITLTILSATCLVIIAVHREGNVNSGFKVGFGSVNAVTLLTNLSHNFVAKILLVNTVQRLITGIYFLYNDMLTRMLLAAEYNDFALHRKPLRVSFPTPPLPNAQPTTSSSPTATASQPLTTFTVIHWLISEGFFFVQVLPYDIWGNPVPPRTLNTCGYSPKALAGAVALIIVLALAIVAISYRRSKAPMMPLALNCSAAISAACHPPASDRDRDPAFRPVM